MCRIIILGIILFFVIACTTPHVVKDASRQQGDLPREFQKTLEDLRTKLLVFYDEEIEDFQQSLLKSRMELEALRVSYRAYNGIQDIGIQDIDPGLSKEERVAKVKEILDAAANYLTELPDFYFEKNYCKVWSTLKPDFLREPTEKCNDAHLKQHQRLLAARKEVGIRFDELVKAVATTKESHVLVNEFLQTEFSLTQERVDKAKKVLEEARRTIEETKEAWVEFRTKKDINQ